MSEPDRLAAEDFAPPVDDAMATGERRREFTLAEVVRRHAAERPEHTALVCGDQRRSFAELDERSSRAANALAALGVGSGDRVAVLMKNGVEFYELAFGAAKLDATLIGLNWRLAPPEIAAILADSTPRVLVAEAELERLVPAAEQRPDGLEPLTLGDEYEAKLAAASPDDPKVPGEPGGVALLLYSSGTTGRPKGVMITNENLSYSATMASRGYRIGPESTNLVVSPLFHIGGAGYGLMALTQGGTTVILREVSAAGILEAIEAERVTHTFVVPAVIQMLVDAPDLAERDISSLAVVCYGGAPMTETLLRKAMTGLRCGFFGVYGMTETAGTVVGLLPSEHDPDGPRTHLLRSIGRPLPWVELQVCEVESGAEQPPGEVGEIRVRCGQTTAGYWGRPEESEAALVDGWLRTGDAAYRDEEGFVFLHDRIKDMVISGGENVYPAEVENVLAEHPAVAEVAVIGVPHERWGETVKAIVVARSGSEPAAQELIEFTWPRLAKYKCPTSVDFVAELPRNPAGKVLKHVLRADYAEASG